MSVNPIIYCQILKILGGFKEKFIQKVALLSELIDEFCKITERPNNTDFNTFVDSMSKSINTLKEKAPSILEESNIDYSAHEDNKYFADIRHDLHNLTCSILGYTELALEECQTMSEFNLEKRLSAILHTAQEVEYMIGELKGVKINSSS